MAKQREPFVGQQLLIFENRLRDRGTISSSWEADDVITFVTEKGQFSFYTTHPEKPVRNAKRLTSGDWKFYGDGPRWAYTRQPTTPDTRGQHS